MSPPATDSPPPPILIVDDETVVLAALKETLEREKYHVVTSSSPLKALELLRTQQFAVILSDQRMPEMQGLDFLIESRKLNPRASRTVPFVSKATGVSLAKLAAKVMLGHKLVEQVRFTRHRPTP